MAGMRPLESNFGANSADSSIWDLSLRSEKVEAEDMFGVYRGNRKMSIHECAGHGEVLRSALREIASRR